MFMKTILFKVLCNHLYMRRHIVIVTGFSSRMCFAELEPVCQLAGHVRRLAHILPPSHKCGRHRGVYQLRSERCTLDWKRSKITNYEASRVHP